MGRTKKKSFNQDINQIADIYKALGHPARLQILQVLLDKKKATCGEIVAELPLAQSTISKHLIELKKANVLAERFEGKKTIFSLKKEGLNDSSEFITNFITKCKYGNHFNATKNTRNDISLEEAIKSDLKSRTHKPNLGLKAHNYIFKKAKINKA
jgi:ArsR family transcriptional regulator